MKLSECIDTELVLDFEMPLYLQEDIKAIEQGILENSSVLDCLVMSLDSSIKMALIDGTITKEQEQLLRKKYKV